MAQSRTTLDPAEAILAALAQLGQTTAADIATAAGLAYSTTTRNLRELAAAGRVEKVTDGKQSQWRLPSGGSAQASATSGAEGGTDAPTAVSSPSTLDRSPADTDLADANATVADLTDADDKGEPDDSGPDAGNHDDGEGDGARPPAVPVEHDGQADGSNNLAADTMADDAAGDNVAPHGEPGTPAGPDQADDNTESDPPRMPESATPGSAPDGADADAKPADGGTDGGTAAGKPVQAGGPAKPRRASGTLDGAVLDILEAHPDRALKVGELCKLIDKANEGQDVSKASPGAVVLACQRLVTKGRAVLAVEKPASFQLATATAAVAADPATGTTSR